MATALSGAPYDHFATAIIITSINPTRVTDIASARRIILAIPTRHLRPLTNRRVWDTASRGQSRDTILGVRCRLAQRTASTSAAGKATCRAAPSSASKIIERGRRPTP